jgi:threonyl-tRNA synthetase
MNHKNPHQALEHKRHSLAHLLAAAVIDLYPTTQVTIGPAIDDGFYYDMDFEENIGEEDLPSIEEKMREILKAWSDAPSAKAKQGFIQKKVSADEARAFFSENPYKLELIEEIAARGEEVTLYVSGHDSDFPFTDLCRGGHVDDLSDIDPESFKLTKTAGAYWRGDEKNKMLTRIYGVAFDTEAELDAYLTQLEEAKKRDHRKLGKELKLFTVSDLVGAGLPLMQPKGMIIREAIADYLWELHKDHGYSRVWTPHIAKVALYETSGHASKFGDELFRVQGKEDSFIMKPMNCPHHMQIFADNQFSYRDMPIRYFEPATVYRDEKSGQLGGLTRVRSITQDDGHLFCRSTQILDEARIIVGIIKKFYATMNMLDGYWVRLSLRGDDKSAYLGSDDVWEMAEGSLKQICDEENLPYKEAKNEAAFYGPKLDFMFKDAIGREWQLATIQLDFNLPERFDLSFINEKGEKERPVVFHRAISGSLERFMGVMIEHFAGAFPLWLSPVQVKIIPIGERQFDYAQNVANEFKKAGIRVETDLSSESLGKKVRASKTEKVPYAIVLGDKEMELGNINLEGRTEKIEGKSIAEAIALLREQIDSRSL